MFKVGDRVTHLEVRRRPYLSTRVRNGTVIEVDAERERARVFWDRDKRTWMRCKVLKPEVSK